MYESFLAFLQDKSRICVIQAENPDGDSLGSALALDYLLTEKQISLYCPVEIPKYLRYMADWSRVDTEFDYKADAYIIVDTAASILLSKLLADTAIRNCLYSRPVFVLDHHETPDDLDFPHTAIIEPYPSCCELIYHLAISQKLPINQDAAGYLMSGVMSDTLGLTAQSVTAETFDVMAGLSRLGAEIWRIEEARREFMRKSQRILQYKADLIKRVEYSLDGALATVHIPWADIEEYSDEYNPNVLIIEELRLVEGVHVSVAIKTYPDGKVTGKIRTDLPIADQIAGFFGGGGHPYAAGFRAYNTTYPTIVQDLIKITPELLATASAS